MVVGGRGPANWRPLKMVMGFRGLAGQRPSKMVVGVRGLAGRRPFRRGWWCLRRQSCWVGSNPKL